MKPIRIDRRQAPPDPYQEVRDAIRAAQNTIIELVFAGNDLASYATLQTDEGMECVCGVILSPASIVTPNHHTFCPVARFHAAVEAVRKVAL